MNNKTAAGTTVITSERLGESLTRIDHPAGMPIFVWHKPGYQSSYAVFATRYGSIDNAFEKDGVRVEVPAGIAHYLEHKLFENEDCDAFAKYAKTGADANAYTSFDRTAYLFSCTGDIAPSLEILLDFVQSPYFTEASVEKERGIIAQEIKMSNDMPGRRVLYNLLRGMYHTHPIRVDIAGTVESIGQITKELLYDCYHTFYNLRNMLLLVVGNATPAQVTAVADRMLKPAEPWSLARATHNEPRTVVTGRVEESMPVGTPLFYLGYKLPAAGTDCLPPETLAAASILLEILCGKSSPLYARLMKQGLINPTFEAELFDGPGYGIWLFAGESQDPDAVAAALAEEIVRLRNSGVDRSDFDAARNALYGRLVASVNDIENCGEIIMADFMYGRTPFAFIDCVAGLAPDALEKVLADNLHPDQCTLSIIKK